MSRETTERAATKTPCDGDSGKDHGIRVDPDVVADMNIAIRR
jgi:hypothetical protein